MNLTDWIIIFIGTLLILGFIALFYILWKIGNTNDYSTENPKKQTKIEDANLRIFKRFSFLLIPFLSWHALKIIKVSKNKKTNTEDIENIYYEDNNQTSPKEAYN